MSVYLVGFCFPSANIDPYFVLVLYMWIFVVVLSVYLVGFCLYIDSIDPYLVLVLYMRIFVVLVA